MQNYVFPQQLFGQEEASWHQRYQELRKENEASLRAKLIEYDAECNQHLKKKYQRIMDQIEEIGKLKVRPSLLILA